MSAATAARQPSSLDAVRRLFRDRPVVPLTGPAGAPRGRDGQSPRRASSRPLGRRDPAHGGPARDPRRLSDPHDADRGHRPVGRRGRVDGRLRDGHAHPLTRAVYAEGIAVALTAAALAGLINGIGVGVFRVHPLIMTLGMSFIVLGLANVWQLQSVQTGAGVPDILRTIGSGRAFDVIPNSLVVFVPVVLADPPGPAPDRLWAPAVRDRRQPGRGPAVRRPVVAGPDRAVRDLGAAGRDRRARPLGRDQHRQRDPRRLARAAVGRGRGHRRDVDPRRPRRLRRHDRRGADPDGDLGAADHARASPRRSARSCSGRSSSWSRRPTPG